MDERDITTPANIGEALGLPIAEAIALLARKHLREGDLARLEAAAVRIERSRSGAAALRYDRCVSIIQSRLQTACIGCEDCG